MKLRNKLIISYFLASIIPILLISLTIYQLSAKSVEDASQEFASMYVSQATTNLDDFMDRHNQSTRSVLLERDIIHLLMSEQTDNMDELIENKLILSRFFSDITTVYPEIDTVMLVGSTGEMYDYTRAPDYVNVEKLQEQDWFKSAKAQERQMFITPIHDRSYYNKEKRGAVFTVGRVLWNYNGSYAGMILMDMDPNKLINLSEIFLSLGNRYDIRLVVTNENGGILYHSDAATGKRSWNSLINQPYKAKDEGDENGLIVLSDRAYGGKLRISAEIPLSKLLAPIQSIKHVTLWSIVVCLIFIAFISILFSYKITKPILNLRRSMKQVELGHYSILIPVPTAHDEISGLVNSYNKMILRIGELIEDVFKAGMKRKQAQFLALQAQINPHMLYNTLESIRMKAVIKEQDDIAEMIKVLARMFRLSLGKDRGSHLIRHEVEYAANYIFLQNIRYDNRFKLDVQLSERVMESPVIPLVFQPIVENSIKHGFRNYNSELLIRIEEEFVGFDEVRIRIIDNGGGLTEQKAREIDYMLQKVDTSGMVTDDQEEESSDSGIGLRNITERLKLQYGERYYLRLDVQPGVGTVVEMLIPLPREG
ncbi:sensor histidine kinase [Paenibacillus sinopodophylli]|uniref:sensor histidine kinase n=1 Tax=Paenibacillus sinopodophylli TaxID=1837342 RepID=UPI00110C9CE6|nr:sensor histidine kinase [Paenibacillus sinopodophylli]